MQCLLPQQEGTASCTSDLEVILVLVAIREKPLLRHSIQNLRDTITRTMASSAGAAVPQSMSAFLQLRVSSE